MQWIMDNYGLIFMVLFGISEAIALIPGVESNSVFQAIFNVLKMLKPAVDKKEQK